MRRCLKSRRWLSGSGVGRRWNCAIGASGQSLSGPCLGVRWLRVRGMHSRRRGSTRLLLSDLMCRVSSCRVRISLVRTNRSAPRWCCVLVLVHIRVLCGGGTRLRIVGRCLVLWRCRSLQLANGWLLGSRRGQFLHHARSDRCRCRHERDIRRIQRPARRDSRLECARRRTTAVSHDSPVRAESRSRRRRQFWRDKRSGRRKGLVETGRRLLLRADV